MEVYRMTNRKKKVLTLAIFAVFILLMGWATFVIGRPIIDFARQPEAFRNWVQGYGILGKILFTGMMILQTIIAFIPGEPMEIVAGYAFGAVSGTVLCMLGEAIGSVMVFLFVRRFGVRMVEVFFPREKIDRLSFLKDERKLKTFTFFVFLTPGTPKDILSYCVGLTRMPLPAWTFISVFARIPSIVTSTVGGNALGLGQTTFAIIVFAVTFVASALGYYFYNKNLEMREKKLKEMQEKKKALMENVRQKKKNMLEGMRALRRMKADDAKKRMAQYKRKKKGAVKSA